MSEPDLRDVLRLLVAAFLIFLTPKKRRRFVAIVRSLIAAEERSMIATPGPRDAGTALRLCALKNWWERVRV